MPTRLEAVVFDAADPARLGRFWADALGWSVLVEGPGGVAVGVPDSQPWGDGGPMKLVFVPVPEPKSGKNRVHLDLASTSLAGQEEKVSALLELGGRRADIGQEEVPWVVMADPEGNELCVLDPRDSYQDIGPVAAVLIDCSDPIELANFWIKATGWPALRYTEQFVALRHPKKPTAWFELLEAPDPKMDKNRLHIDLAVRPGGDLTGETARLERIGGRRVDIGQGNADWTVMADPEGNELCVLPPS